MTSNLYIKILFFFFWFSFAFSQLQWNSNKEKISIPFELTHNLIIVDVIINNVDLKMVLDTGSERNLLFSFPEQDSIEFYSPKIIQVKGLGYGETLEAIISSDNHFTTKKGKLFDKNFEILLITNQNIGLINKLGIPINGIIGSSFFKEFLVEIKYSSKRIVLHKKKDKIISRISNRYDETEIEIIQNKPYLKLDITNRNKLLDVNLLYDTGLGDGLWLFENDSIKCSNVFF